MSYTLQGKRFQRRQEDFICERCHQFVRGNGFTNHCPKCLFSKHVDRAPGDRLAQCGGLMMPVLVEKKNSEWKILHRCSRCGHEKYNKRGTTDSLDALLSLM